jgi:hypothetical protein
MRRNVFLIPYGETGVSGVLDAVAVLINVAVGICVSVGAVVAVDGINVFVAVGKFGITVTPGMGVCVGTFGTQRSWPV